jgi:hypothetical protein
MRGCGEHDVEDTRGIWQELVVWLVSAVVDLGRRQKEREGGGYIYTVLGHKSCNTFPKSPPHQHNANSVFCMLATRLLHRLQCLRH